ncbi:MAG TPA: hypothetical protein VFM54_13920 [Micromonosporaceae bacterium]|nr:hypothetical protein [Micromonosporaceae bacterium]
MTGSRTPSPPANPPPPDGGRPAPGGRPWLGGWAGLGGAAWLTGRRATGLCGLAAVALTLPAFVLLPPAPAAGTPAGRVVAYYQQHGDAFLAYGWLLGLSVPLMVVHLAAVAHWMRGQARLPGPLWLVYLAGATLGHTVQLLLLAVFQVLVLVAGHPDSALVRPLSELANVGFSYFAVAQAVPLAAGALAVARTGVVWRWLAWPAAAAVALCLLGSLGTVSRSGPLAGGALATSLWYLAFLAVFTLVNAALLGRPRAAAR